MVRALPCQGRGRGFESRRSRMTPERHANMTAEEWLTHASSPNEWTFLMRLARVETERIEAEASQPIQDALFYKGLSPRDLFLAPGEFERLVAIIQSQYPFSFNLWLKTEIAGLKKNGGDTRYFVELKPPFESAEGYEEVRDIIEWI